MIVLDTSVISEIFRPRPDVRVVAWLESLTADVAITAVTLAGLAAVRRLPDGRRKKDLAARIEAAVELYRDDRSVLSFDVAAAEQYADILGVRETAGLPISTADAQIAAICRARNATCATRDLTGFAHTGVELVDPWSASGGN